ncbi:hypothetical protein D3C75_881630 [compost metagenome]
MLADGGACRRQYQRVTTHLRPLHRRAGQQRVAGPHHQAHRLAVQVLERQALDLRAVGHAPDHQFQFAQAQLAEQLRADPGDHTDHQRLMALVQAAQHFGHEQAFDRGQHADAHLRGRPRLATQAADAIAQGLHAGPGIAHETRTGRGQLDALAAAREQARFQQVFEFLEGLGDGWLADCQDVGSPGQAALPGNLQEAQQVAVLDAGVEVHGLKLTALLGLVM